MSVNLPPCPGSLKPIQHYLKTASEHDDREPVISYWCRLCALQTALKLDKKSDDAKSVLTALMDWLETAKRSLRDNEAISNDVAAQAHVENYALKLFLWADGQDRAGIFNKNVVKAFYTSGILMDVLSVFGELSEEVVTNRKYAKWKATYIHTCLKNGEAPVPGPMRSEDDDVIDVWHVNYPPDVPGPSATGPSSSGLPKTIGFQLDEASTTSKDEFRSPITQNTSDYSQPNSKPSVLSSISYSEDSGTKLTPEQVTKAQKYCRLASAALTYEDIKDAMENLHKALKLLQTGDDC